MLSPMVSTGGLQILSGFVLILTDIICMAMYNGFSIQIYLPLILGIKYVVTGGLGVAGGKAAPGSARGLAIASLVMSILSILSSFGLLIICAISIAGFAISGSYVFTGLVSAQLVFFTLMFISSIVLCVFAVRAMSSSTRTTHVNQVTYVAGQPGVGYAGGPLPYPAGQPGQRAAPYPQKA